MIVPRTPLTIATIASGRGRRSRGTRDARRSRRAARPPESAAIVRRREERRLPSADGSGEEDLRAEELRDADSRRNRAPERRATRARSTRSRVRRISSGSAGASSAYSANFVGRHAVRVPRVRRRVDVAVRDLDHHPREEQPDREPEPAPARERREAVAEAAPGGGDDDREHGEVRQVRVHGRRTEADAEPGLVVDVQEEDRDRRCEHERARRHRRRETPLPPSLSGQRAGGQGPATILASPDEPASRTPIADGRRHLLIRRCSGSSRPSSRRRILSKQEFGDFATVIYATSFFQSFFDLTVEEALVKYGFRYVDAVGVGPAAEPLPKRVPVQARRLADRRAGAARARRVRTVAPGRSRSSSRR